MVCWLNGNLYFKWLLGLIALCCLFPISVTAQLTGSSKSPFFKVADLEGLKIKCILQDKNGFMWFGTETGLYRYDGYNTEIISTNSPNIRLASDLVFALYEDRQANLWIGTGNGLQRLSPDRKSNKTYLATSGKVAQVKKAVVAITQTHDGAIWASADNGYLYRSADQKSFSQISDSYAADYTGLQRIVETMYEDKQHRLWVADIQHGYRVLNHNGQLQMDFSLWANREPVAFFADKNSQILVNQRKIYVYRPHKNKFIPLSENGQLNVLKNPLRYVYQDKKGYMWLANQNKLLRLDPKSNAIEDFTGQFMQSGANYFRIECIYEDANNQLWFGSYFGAFKLNNQESFFETISLPKGIGANPYFSTRGLLQAPDGDLYIGSYSGFFKHNRVLNNFKEYKIKADSTWKNPLVRALVPDTNGNLWLATEAFGLVHFNPKIKAFTPYLNKTKITAKNKAPLVSTHNYSLLKDTRGQLWLGGYNNLYTFNPQNGKAQVFSWGANKKNFSLFQILALHLGRDNSVWLGTDYGLYRLQKEKNLLIHYNATAPGSTKPGLSQNIINCIYEDQKGWLWLGTKGGGILVLNPKSGKVVGQYTLKDGLADNRVCAILPGAENELWISTFNGLSRLNIQTKSFRNFYTTDGLATDEFNQGSALAGTDGNLYFGSMDGIVYFNPTQTLPLKKEPQVMLTKLIQHNGRKNKIEETAFGINSLSQIKLNYLDKFFTIFFAPKNYFEMPNGHHQFAYRLAGLTDEWQNIGAVNFIQLAGLPAGNYTLNIRAKGSNGTWGKALSIPVLVGQAFYLTTAAYLFYALVALGIIGIIFWFQLSRIRLQNKLALEHLQKAKLEELNELKTQFFTNITHEFRTPLTLIISPLEQLRAQLILPDSQTIRQQHTIIYRNAQRLLRLISQLLDSAKLEAGNLKATEGQGNVIVFIGQVVETFRSQAQKNKIVLNYQAEAKPGDYFFDADKLENIIYNLLSNALKFTPAGGAVEVKLSWHSGKEEDDLLCLRVTDTGIGISEAQLPFVFNRFYQVIDHRTRSLAGSGLGLFLVKELSELLGGNVAVASQLNKGTTFTVTLPLRIADSLTWAEPVAVLPKIVPEPEVEITYTDLPEAPAEAPLVLVVEDHDELRTFISRGLSDKYRVIMATDGAEGWRLTQQDLPDLIIADVTMPQLDGFSLSRLIKETPLTTHIPVILLTARASAENRVQGLAAGANDYLTKPFNLQELQLRVANWLSYQHTLRQYWHSQFLQPHSGDSLVSLPEKPVEDPFLREVYRILDLELANGDFAVDQLASEMMVSTRTLHRKLSALTNLNANTLIRNYRLGKAAILLREGHSVSEVASLTGFEGLSYFSKCFKEQFSVSPSHYALSQTGK